MKNGTERPAHPLFPGKDEGEDPAEVVWIQIYRVENNQKMYVGRFKPDELQDESEIVTRYGGGTYELHARNNTHITDKRAIQLPGPSKPLYTAPPGEASNGASAAIPVAQQTAQAPGAPSWLPIMATLLPLLLQWLSGQQEAARMDRQSQQALLTAMMKQGQDSNAQMITLLATLKGPSGGSGDGFKDGMAFMRDFVAGQMEELKMQQQNGGGEEGDIMKTIESLSKVAEMINGLSNAGSGPPTQTIPTEGSPTA